MCKIQRSELGFIQPFLKPLHVVFPELLASHPFPLPSFSSLRAGQFQTHSVTADVTVLIHMHRDMRGQRHWASLHLGNDVAWAFFQSITITLWEHRGFYNNLCSVNLKQHLFTRDVFYNSYVQYFYAVFHWWGNNNTEHTVQSKGKI